MAIIDIDHFKRLNHTQGHDAGDAALKSLSRVLNKEIGTNTEEDPYIFRYGGEEFVLLFTIPNKSKVQEQLEQLRQSWADNRVRFNNVNLGEITMSLGLAFAPKYGTSGSEIIAAADAALYAAKENGRNRIEIAQ